MPFGATRTRAAPQVLALLATALVLPGVAAIPVRVVRPSWSHIASVKLGSGYLYGAHNGVSSLQACKDYCLDNAWCTAINYDSSIARCEFLNAPNYVMGEYSSTWEVHYLVQQDHVFKHVPNLMIKNDGNRYMSFGVAKEACELMCRDIAGCTAWDMVGVSGTCHLTHATTAEGFSSNAGEPERNLYQIELQDFVWVPEAGNGIDGSDISGLSSWTLGSVVTLEQCKYWCQKTQGCTSFEYTSSTSACDLKNANLNTVVTTWRGVHTTKTLYRYVPQTTAPTASPSASPTAVPTPVPPSEATLTVPSGLTSQTRLLPTDLDASYSGFEMDAFGKVMSMTGSASSSVDFTGVKEFAQHGIVFDITDGSNSGVATEVPANSVFTVHCDIAESCDAYVFVYHEPPASSSSNGDLPATLDQEEWEPSSCAPTFTLPGAVFGGADPGMNCTYKMGAFRKVMNQGDSVDITVGSRPVKYMFIMLVPKVQCQNSMTESECTATHSVAGRTSTCIHTSGGCVDRYCYRASSSSGGSSPAGPTSPTGPTPPTPPTPDSDTAASDTAPDTPAPLVCPAANSA